MYKVVNVGDKEIPMRASGRTPLYYKQVFHADLLSKMVSDGNQITLVESALPELAYIMAMNGSDMDMSKINEDLYAEWLEQFEPMDLLVAGEDIFKVYLGNLQTDSESKKKADEEQNEK